MPADLDVNAHDVFLLRQKWTMVINRYIFSLPNLDDEEGWTIAFVEQKRFKFKEDIRFYTDETKRTELLRIKARQRFDPRARYDVTGPGGEKIGEIQKVFGQSLLRSTYRLFDAHGFQTCEARERSLPVALLRRVVGFVPYVGQWSNWLPIPYHFVFTRGDQVLVHHVRQRWKLNDHYTIDCRPDSGRTLDRRLVLAAAVGMDALQGR
uniref:Uncharacterized protein n=1 Tax=uncultured Nocardioidaceae bacterium TaxID=253824 RepID=A0A6J4L3V9_9ACTN|nr:MAG: hypothetical protein AVDCRST_MAG46-860 [uncultured Nocardioidaceae bacterium]